MVSEEQEEEFEALEAIYPEIERIEWNRKLSKESDEELDNMEPNECLVFAIDLASETEENQLRKIYNSDIYGCRNEKPVFSINDGI